MAEEKDVFGLPKLEKFYLSDEQVKKLQELDPIIEHAKSEIQRAEKVGLDVSVLKQKLEDLIKLRDNILKEYTKPPVLRY